MRTAIVIASWMILLGALISLVINQAKQREEIRRLQHRMRKLEISNGWRVYVHTESETEMESDADAT